MAVTNKALSLVLANFQSTNSRTTSASGFPRSTHTVEQKNVLQYASDPSTTTDVSPHDWESLSPNSYTKFAKFPPQSTPDPVIGDGIATATLSRNFRTCQPYISELTDSHRSDLLLVGRIELTNPHYLIELQRVEFVDDGETAAVEIANVDYQRPPSMDCETTYVQYEVDLSFEAEPPSSIDVIHRDATGGELERTTVTR